MQAGAFSDRAKAEQIRQMLNSKGESYNPAVELIVATATNTGVLALVLSCCSARKSIHPATVRTAPIAKILDPRLTRSARFYMMNTEDLMVNQSFDQIE